MLKVPRILILLCAITTLAKSQQKPYTKLTDTLTVQNKTIFGAETFSAASETFVYAVCEDAYLEERYCNVTIQIEAQKRTCPVRIAPIDSGKTFLSFFSQLNLYPLGYDKVMIMWADHIEFRWNASYIQILDITTCELVDVPLPAAQVIYAVAYKDAIDLGFWNKDYCGSKNCKITINADGQLISGPTDILKNVDVAYVDMLGPVNQNAPDQGFYAAVGLQSEFGHGHHNEYFYKINGNGKSIQFMTFERTRYVRPSTSNDFFSLCHTVGKVNTTVACVQYDQSLKLRLNTTLEFEDGTLPLWFQPHNLKAGGLLLVTGRATDVEGTSYKTFRIVKIHQNGQVEKTIEIDDLEFTCASIQNIYVKVLDDSGEICVHFTCTHEETDDEGQKTNTLQLAIKCY